MEEMLYENENENTEFIDDLQDTEAGEIGEKAAENIGEGQTEVRQDVTEIIDKTEHVEPLDTVSDGDSNIVYYETNYDEELATIIEEIVLQREQLDTLQEYMEYSNQNIYDKPLEDYSVTESLMLVTMFVVLFGVLIKLIGGIITCKV